MGTTTWQEKDTAAFVDHGDDFVPERGTQIATMCALLPVTTEPFAVIDLCCGEGLLSQAILERFPEATVTALDGSKTMLERARARNRGFGERFRTRRIELEATDWRTDPAANEPRAVVSSLAIHHLDGAGKKQLYRDLFALLAPGGALIIADLVAPASGRGEAVAADAWDQAVAARGDGALEAFRAERWNHYRYPDPIDRPSPLFDQLCWLDDAGFTAVDVFWLRAGHAIFGGRKPPLDEP